MMKEIKPEDIEHAVSRMKKTLGVQEGNIKKQIGFV